MKTIDEDEEERLEDIQVAKLRGKGAPKKKRTAEGMEEVTLEYRLDANRLYRKQEAAEEIDYASIQFTLFLVLHAGRLHTRLQPSTDSR